MKTETRSPRRISQESQKEEAKRGDEIMIILELGTTTPEVKDSMTVDLRPPAKPHAHIIHNLNNFPYPLPSNHFDLIIASHIIEHLTNTPKVMAEIHRIAKPNAKVIIRIPHYTSAGAYEHPTHVRYFSLNTFKWFCGSEHAYHTNVKFKQLSAQFRLYKSNPMGKLFNKFANINPVFFERHLACFFGVAEVITELEVIK